MSDEAQAARALTHEERRAQSLPASLLAQRAEQLRRAHRMDVEGPAGSHFERLLAAGQQTYLQIEVAALACAIPLSQLTEVMLPPPLTRIPLTPSWVCGVCNIRGEIVDVLDLGHFLGLRPARRLLPTRGRLLCCDVNGARFALWVEQTSSLASVDKEALQSLPTTARLHLHPCVIGAFAMDEEKAALCIALDLELLLQMPVISALRREREAL